MAITELKYKNYIIYGLSILFILINSFVIYFFGFLYFSIIPIVLLVAIIGFNSYDKLFYLIAFFTPLSLSLSYFFPDSSFNISIFTEPLLIFLLFILLYKSILYHKIRTDIVFHPITIAVVLYLFWILITTITSSLPLVSVKFFLSKVWLIVPIFFLGVILFNKTSNTKLFIWAYGIALFVVVLYSIYNLSQTSFLAKNAAHFAVKPFFKDHTSYGAILAMFIPVFLGLASLKSTKIYKRLFALGFAIVFMGGLFLSYSRAAWISLIVAIIVWIFVKLKIKFKYIAVFAVIAGVIIFSFWFQIMNKLEKNQQDSSSNITEEIASMANVSTDASNLERLNRWQCAIEMFKEKPLVGWGPGTYQFQYAPFQLERMRTIISTNFGDVGNAHSEYLGALSEQGFLGLLSFLFLAISIIFYGLRAYKFALSNDDRTIVLNVTLGLITYFIHGFMNNFLDTDKLAIPFFAFAAIIVSLDLKNKNTKT